MKTQHKLQHLSPPVRKSPRFSPPAPAPASTQPERNSIHEDGNAWALSLHVVDPHPQPLRIVHPSSDDDDDEDYGPASSYTPPIRRSSRFTQNMYRTPSSGSSLRKMRAIAGPALVGCGLRRSPRFVSSPALTLTLRSGRVVGSRKRMRSEEGLVVKKGKIGLDRIGDSGHEVLALPAGSSERRLRSRNVLLHVGNEGEKKWLRSGIVKSRSPQDLEKRVLRSGSRELTSVQISDSGEKWLRSRVVKCALTPEALKKRVGRSDSSVERSVYSEKCLRSRTVKMVVGEGESGSKSSDGGSSVRGKCLRSKDVGLPLIEWPGDSDKGRGGSSVRRSSRLVKEGDERLKVESVASDDKNLVEGSPDSGEKCLRSRTVKMQVEKQISASPKSSNRASKSKLDFEGVSGIKNELGQCDSEMTSEKSLRSRKIQFKVIVDEKTSGESASKKGKSEERAVKSEKTECSFIGEPIPEEEAQERWGWRYELKRKRKGKSGKINAGEEDEVILNVDLHYAQAKIGTYILDIGDCAYVKGEGKKKHIGRILEFFRTTEGEDYFRVQWFFRAEDTVLRDAASSHDKKRVFYSTLTNDNMLDCIISKVNIIKILPALSVKSDTIKSAAFYYDMEYCVDYSTFRTMCTENSTESPDLFLTNTKIPDDITTTKNLEALPDFESSKSELALLDLYSGCGGMSTGLCFGAKISNLNLVTKWAVDYNSFACESLKLNHPETQVRNESAEDFLELLKKWEELCKLHMCSLESTLKYELEDFGEAEDCMTESDMEVSSGEFEVGYLVDICFGDPNETGKRRLHFKVRWKGYGPDEDTWEPIEGLSNCEERIQDFVRKGFKSKILPLPGDVDVICGGPPCQGISGYNRYRNFDSPLSDERNHQIVVFMDIVEFLKPKFVLMENVVDIIRFDKASLARYALSRLAHMKYQTRLGTIASGCYGLPQFRLRVFIWGADPHEKLPQFPLPTHDVVVRYWPPPEYERNVVAYDEGQPRTLEDAIILSDSISDLPVVTNNEDREEMSYEKPPETEFQSYIRLNRDEFMGIGSTPHSQTKHSVLYDHRPLQLHENDYLRICQVPHKKGANFRDLPGVIVGEDNVARLDPTIERVMLPSGKPLVPDSVFSIDNGKSRRPYSRVWWDETVSTILTYPHVRMQTILHPEQDRVLTIRECARLQGFPDFYRFCGTIKERYRQVGNAVSIPVARALGYALGMAYQKLSGDEPLMKLPPKFSSLLPSSDQTVL